MINKNVLISASLILLIFIALAAYLLIDEDSPAAMNGEDDLQNEVSKKMSDTSPSGDNSKIISTNNEYEVEYDYVGELEDVTDTETPERLLGLNTNGIASGVAKYKYENNVFKMLATFSNLPEPNGTDFYEGWLVRMEPFDFISTGKVEKIDNVYTNTYMSNTNYSDYNLYVLTIEPDDGDPAPAGHIVEGKLEIK